MGSELLTSEEEAIVAAEKIGYPVSRRLVMGFQHDVPSSVVHLQTAHNPEFHRRSCSKPRQAVEGWVFKSVVHLGTSPRPFDPSLIVVRRCSGTLGCLPRGSSRNPGISRFRCLGMDKVELWLLGRGSVVYRGGIRRWSRSVLRRLYKRDRVSGSRRGLRAVLV